MAGDLTWTWALEASDHAWAHCCCGCEQVSTLCCVGYASSDVPPPSSDKLRCSTEGCLHPRTRARQSTHTHSHSACRGFRVNEHETEHLIYSQPGEYVIGRSRPPTPRPRSPVGHSLSLAASPEQPR